MPTTLTVTSPSSYGAIELPFTIQGTCSENHLISADIGGKVYTAQTVNHNFSIDIPDTAPTGTFTISVWCGDPAVYATIYDLNIMAHVGPPGGA